MAVLSKRKDISNCLNITNEEIIDDMTKNILMSGDRIMELISTDGKDKRFIELCSKLDEYLNDSVGGEKQKKEYNKYNTLDDIHDVILILDDDNPVACGSFKEYEKGCAELKRVFVKKEVRKQGLGRKLVEELEKKAKSQGYSKMILETGKALVSAQNLYLNLGFKIIENYGQYKNMSGSICMEKIL